MERRFGKRDVDVDEEHQIVVFQSRRTEIQSLGSRERIEHRNDIDIGATVLVSQSFYQVCRSIERIFGFVTIENDRQRGPLPARQADLLVVS